MTADHLHSVRNLLDSVGSVQATYEYDPYGRATKTSGAVDAFFGFTAHLASSERDLDLPVFRAYDPDLGRWMSEDPLGVKDGPNKYAYVHDRPVSSTDSSGLCSDCRDCPGGTWIGSAGLAELGFALGKVTFGGLVFAGVLVCTSSPSVNIPYVSLCGFGGGQAEPHKKSKCFGAGAEVGAAPFMKCSGYTCSQNPSGTEWGGYLSIGPVFGFKEGTSSSGCWGVGGASGGGLALGCHTWVGK